MEENYDPQEIVCSTPGAPQEPVFHGDYSFNTGKVKTLTTADYAIFIVSLVVSTIIGAYVTWFNRKKLGIAEYLLAGRTMGTLPVTFSLLMGTISAVTVMGQPAEIYHFSTMFMYTPISYIFVAYLAVMVYVPVFYQLKVTCTHEYLERRFNRVIRTLACIFFIFQIIVYMGIVLSVPSVALSQVAELDSTTAIASIGVVGILYTTLGGMKAVIWTDFFQGIAMLLGQLAMLAWVNRSILSWDDVIKSAKRTNRLLFDDFRLGLSKSYHTGFWSIVASGFNLWLTVFGGNQIMIHRCLTCQSLGGAKKAIWMWTGLTFINTLTLCSLGLFMSTFYENCDPFKAKIINKSTQLMPLFVMDAMSTMTGLPGVFLLLVVCGALSTLSTGLSSLSTAVMEDFIRTYSTRHINDNRARHYSQLVCLFFGVVSYEVAYLMLGLDDGLLAAVKMFTALAAPVTGVFTVGLYFPWVNSSGALAGLLVGASFNILQIVVENLYSTRPKHGGPLKCVSNCNIGLFFNSTTMLASQEPLDHGILTWYGNMSAQWIGLISIGICIVVSLVVSRLTGDLDSTSVDPRLIVPVADELFPFYYLPENIREKLRFGLDHTDKWRDQSTGKSIKSCQINGNVMESVVVPTD